MLEEHLIIELTDLTSSGFGPASDSEDPEGTSRSDISTVLLPSESARRARHSKEASLPDPLAPTRLAALTAAEGANAKLRILALQVMTCSSYIRILRTVGAMHRNYAVSEKIT